VHRAPAWSHIVSCCYVPRDGDDGLFTSGFGSYTEAAERPLQRSMAVRQQARRIPIRWVCDYNRSSGRDQLLHFDHGRPGCLWICGGPGGRRVAARVHGSRIPKHRVLPEPRGLAFVGGPSFDPKRVTALVPGIRASGPIKECGLFVVDVHGNAEKAADNLEAGCDYVSSWHDLSFSPDGLRAVGIASRGQLGRIDLERHRVEVLWKGSAAAWSPDGRWVAMLTFDLPVQLLLLDARDLSVRRNLGKAESSRVQWSPDSKYLLLWRAGFCGLSSGYFGTLQALDVESGERLPIESSRCRVNGMATGWVGGVSGSESGTARAFHHR